MLVQSQNFFILCLSYPLRIRIRVAKPLLGIRHDFPQHKSLLIQHSLADNPENNVRKI